MRTISMALLIFVVVAAGSKPAASQKKRVAEDPREAMRRMMLERFERTGRRGRASSMVPTRTIRRRPAPIWNIPQGKFGLMLNDGTRMIGNPAADWSATLKTNFGLTVIPRIHIRRIEAGTGGQVAITLKNGDRVSGYLKDKYLPFVTAFGRLTVPLAAFVRLTSDDVALQQ